MAAPLPDPDGVLLPPLVLLLLIVLAIVATFFVLFLVQATRRRMRGRNAELMQLKQTNADLMAKIAALREKEQVWRISEERLRSLTSLSADWYWEQDTAFRFTMRSSWTLGHDRIPAEQFLGKTRWDLALDPADEYWFEHRATLEEHEPFRGFEYRFLHNGREFWVSVNGEPRFDQSGTFLGYRGTGRDITQRKNIEAALRASEERFQEIVNFMPVGLFIKDARTHFTLMNLECERLWGVRFIELEGTDGHHVFTPDEMSRFLDADRRAYEERQILVFEETYRNVSTNELRTVRELKKAVFDEDGKPRYLIGISIDITERKHAELLLCRSEERLRQLAVHQAHLKEQERKRIARDIHDDLGQNLLALRIEVSTLVQRTMGAHPKLNKRARSVMENVDLTIRSVRNIINDLRPAVLDLGVVAALEWQVDDFMKRSALSCTLEMDVEELELALDDAHATVLFRVLQESLTNIQRHANASQVRISLRKLDDVLELGVNDDGIGGVHLHDTHSGQTFGLLGMRERLVTLGGALTINSEPGEGTTLIASLPLSHPPPEAAVQDSVPRERSC